MKKTIWGNCLVCNEENWVWYAIKSVINHLDRLLVWDTGSTDRTVQIIKSIKSPKIVFKEYGSVTPESFVRARQKMLEATQADWLFLIDGDEIWTEEGIRRMIKAIQEKGDKIESVVVETINLVGDIYHCSEERAGRYEIAGRKGHYNLRAMNLKIPGLHASLPYGQQGYFDDDERPIQERDSRKILFLPVHYFHATHLPRSSRDKDAPSRKKRRKYEIGTPLSREIKYPEVFYLKRPKNVPAPWLKMSRGEWVRGAVQTPFKKIKRRVFK